MFTSRPTIIILLKLKTGVDRKTIKLWWDKREEYASSKYKKSPQELTSEKFKGKYPQMEVILDAWTHEIRDAGCCLSGSRKKSRRFKF